MANSSLFGPAGLYRGRKHLYRHGMSSGRSNPQSGLSGGGRLVWFCAASVILGMVLSIGITGCAATKGNSANQEPNPDAANPEQSSSDQGSTGAPVASGSNPNAGVIDTGPGQGDAPGTAETTWPFRPARVRIHPLSHYVPEDPAEGRVLRVRLEFVDRYGHTTKCLGQVRLELFRAGTMGTGERVNVPPDAEPLGAWTFDLSDLAVNLDRYDEITRTYLVPIKPPADLELPSLGVLVARVQCEQVVLIDRSYVRFSSPQ